MVSVAFGKPLLDGALLRLDCEVRAEHDAGDHLIVVGDVREIAVVDDADAASLLFYKGGYSNIHDSTASKENHLPRRLWKHWVKSSNTKRVPWLFLHVSPSLRSAQSCRASQKGAEMTDNKPTAAAKTPHEPLLTGTTPRDVVAVVLTYYGRIGLFKRSRHVGSDPDRWHCITGYVDGIESPSGQALLELREETGLERHDIKSLVAGEVLNLGDRRGDTWRVHTFLASTDKRRLKLNWEHTDYRWVSKHHVSRFDGQVEWLSDVIDALGTSAANSESRRGRPSHPLRSPGPNPNPDSTQGKDER
jgi:ADP-ribose pyrophosphatase YjhB (NUDIX family)